MARCAVCRKTLTDPVSISRGYGPTHDPDPRARAATRKAQRKGTPKAKTKKKITPRARRWTPPRSPEEDAAERQLLLPID